MASYPWCVSLVVRRLQISVPRVRLALAILLAAGLAAPAVVSRSRQTVLVAPLPMDGVSTPSFQLGILILYRKPCRIGCRILFCRVYTRAVFFRSIVLHYRVCPYFYLIISIRRLTTHSSQPALRLAVRLRGPRAPVGGRSAFSLAATVAANLFASVTSPRLE